MTLEGAKPPLAPIRVQRACYENDGPVGEAVRLHFTVGRRGNAVLDVVKYFSDSLTGVRAFRRKQGLPPTCVLDQLLEIERLAAISVTTSRGDLYEGRSKSKFHVCLDFERTEIV